MTDVRNLQGDVVAIYCADGVIVARYAYDAWGNLLYSSGYMAEINPIRYRGYYWDAETQLFYLQSRYYDPQLRRFISADVYMDTADGILGTNMYAYCHNDPINYWDPNGERRLPSAMWDAGSFLALLNSFSLGSARISEAGLLQFAANNIIGTLLFNEYGRELELHLYNLAFENGILSGTAGYFRDGRFLQFEFIAGRAPNMREYANAQAESRRGFRITRDGWSSSVSPPQQGADFGREFGNWLAATGAAGLYAFSPGHRYLREINSLGARGINQIVLIPTSSVRW